MSLTALINTHDNAQVTFIYDSNMCQYEKFSSHYQCSYVYCFYLQILHIVYKVPLVKHSFITVLP